MIDTASLLAFAAAYLAAVLLPGPGVTALIARVLARGTRGNGLFIAGFTTASLLWFSLAATGLSVLAAGLGSVFVLIRILGAAWLLYMTWKMWHAPVLPPREPAVAADGAWRLFLAGLATNLGNPKAMVFFLALLPAVVPVGNVGPGGFAVLAGTVLAIVVLVLGSYALAAGRARQIFASARARRLAQRGGSLIMASTAAGLALR